MNPKLHIRMLAIACWLTGITLAIPPLAHHAEWTQFRDGTHVTGKVERVERSRRGAYMVEVSYGDRQRTTFYPRDAPGETVELVVPTDRGPPIRASRLDDKRPSPWLWAMFLGIPVLGALGVALWRAPTRAARRRAARTAPLDALVDAIHFTRRVSIMFALGFAASAMLLGIMPLFERTGTAGAIAVEGLAAISLRLAVSYVRRAVTMRDPKQSPVFDLIVQRPNELAWFYIQEAKEQLRQRSYSLRLWTTTGKQLALEVIPEDIDAVMAAVAKQAPHARRGWSPELERAYKQQVQPYDT